MTEIPEFEEHILKHLTEILQSQNIKLIDVTPYDDKEYRYSKSREVSPKWLAKRLAKRL